MDARTRAARLDDIEAIRAVERRAGRRFAEAGYPAIAAFEVLEAAALRAGIEAGGLLVLADPEDVPVGFVLLEPAPDAAHVHEIDVAPEWQRRGLGRRLLDHAAGWALGRGLDRLTLTTYRDLPFNAPFYSRYGFRVLGEREQGPRLAAIRAEERARGIEIVPRVAMALDL